MIPSLRQQFNARFTLEKYATFLRRIDDLCGTHVQFRISETPCFFPKELIDRMAADGKELIRQLVDNPEYRAKSEEAIPAEFKVPNDAPHPMFVQVDFGLVRDAAGELHPKLVELQAFPSLYAYQGYLAQAYIDVFELRAPSPESQAELKYLLSGLATNSYRDLLRRAIVGSHNPENVVLMEIHPQQQKTLPDFLLTEKMLGVRAVDIVDITKQGSRLYYEQNGKRIPIKRIYNRTIVDELQRKNIQPAFDWRDDLEVEWAGHPNWYFRISKFAIPWLRHPSVPPAVFLDDWYDGEGRDLLPTDREQWVFKPLYSFAGKGVQFAPTEVELDSIPRDQRHNFLLQQRVKFEPVIDTPYGPTQTEVRIMYVWPDEGTLEPVICLIRMGRGKMMGVDHNRNQEWVGASAGFCPKEG
jgi:hypothetical protein